jgi:hypothetical protein
VWAAKQRSPRWGQGSSADLGRTRPQFGHLDWRLCAHTAPLDREPRAAPPGTDIGRRSREVCSRVLYNARRLMAQRCPAVLALFSL